MYRYGDDVLADPSRHRREPDTVTLRRGLLVEVLGDGFVGSVVGASRDRVELQDRRGRRRSFGLDGTFVVDERHVRLRLPEGRPRPATLGTTASGSVPVADRRARTARASRILVEGLHDAELLEAIWGEDLRVEGIVVEIMDGADDVGEQIAAFGPAPNRRLGVLLDHLVPGSKESRIAATVTDPHVLVAGHPFVDVWEAVKPEVLGITAWPRVPRDEDWKTGVAQRLGYADPATAWRRIRGAVTVYTDLDRRFVGAVESLIDFCTAPQEDR